MIIRLILGDQLNENHSWFESVDVKVCYVMMEIRQETDYVIHHIQKVVAFFIAMRQFKETLISLGHNVHYIELDDPKNTQKLSANLNKLLVQYKATGFDYQMPDEYRVDQILIFFSSQLNIPVKLYDSEHFMTTRETLKDFFEGKKQLVMEYFYRKMRRDFHILMDGENPLGGKWNFDKNNRNKWKGDPKIPIAFSFEKESIKSIASLLKKEGVKTLGTIDTEVFLFPSSRNEAFEQLNYFNKQLLVYFGTYQDAMHTEEINLFHLYALHLDKFQNKPTNVC